MSGQGVPQTLLSFSLQYGGLILDFYCQDLKTISPPLLRSVIAPPPHCTLSFFPPPQDIISPCLKISLISFYVEGEPARLSVPGTLSWL